MALTNTTPYRHFSLFRTVFCTAFMVVSSILLLTSSFALAQEDLYIVEDIEVDVTADNAVEAREKAFEAAQIKGYEMLAARFLSAEELESFETPDINTVANFVQDYEVTNEKLSAIRYKGVYKIRYSSQTFGNAGVDSVQNASASQNADILILPFYEMGGRTVLWQNNPFLNAWARARGYNTLGRGIVPVGDLKDITQVRDDQALNYDPSRLNAIRLRYQARETAILIATPEIMTDGTQTILISIYSAKPYGPELSQQVSVRSFPGEVPEQLYNRAVSEVSKTLQAGWQRQTAVETAKTVVEEPLTGPIKSITAQLNFTSVREWVDTKRTLERTRGVKSVQVKSLSPRQATMDINFQGGIQNLRYALQQANITLNDPRTQYTQTGTGQAPIYQIYKSSVVRPY